MRSPVQEYLESIVAQCAGTEGEVAAYIPELAAADPDRFALALATVDGYVYTVGDAEARYSIQSISKPFTYALAVADQGLDAVARKLDVEPSGEAFNEISVSPRTGRPRNPMINAGAITAASLVAGASGEERSERLLQWYSAFADRELRVDESIYSSELATAHRNRAIAHMLRELEILTGDPEEVLEQYVRQCSVEVDTHDLALMAATLANGGVQPRTGEQVLETKLVERVLSVMATCGMYDAAGDWISAVGMPAKSGVSGGIIAVLPGQVGLAVFSPRVDAHGNSTRGVRLCERMSADMEMHLMHVGRSSRTAVRAAYPLSQHVARRRRTRTHHDVIEEHAQRCWVYELHGDLLFAEAEHVVRRIVQDEPEIVVLDVRRIDDVTGVALETLLGLRAMLREAGSEGVVVDPHDVLLDPDAGGEDATPRFRDLDAAVAWCEEELLRRHGGDVEPDTAALIDDHPLLRDLSPRARAAVDAELERLSWSEGEIVLEAGGPFAGIHLIVSGEAVATVRQAAGSDEPDEPVVLVTMSPGTSFGELALGTGGVQETCVRAVSDLEALRLPAGALEAFDAEQPEVALEIWRAMTRAGYRAVDQALRAASSRSD